MESYLECQDCEFVLLAAGSSTTPRRWESCPACGGTDFRVLVEG